MSKSSILEVRNVSKKYYISHMHQASYNTLVETLSTQARVLLRKLRSRFDSSQYSAHCHLEEFWALKDISFEIEAGDRLGIIGRNGAGKSTLLKILSRIIEPTAGQILIRGKISSLLEVGTGFHPELTGRENIFLNGAILGMSKSEIIRKFDEIVAFAEIEKFLDTPVKRFSSGMYTRLGFAIAAHLDPHVLILDEVLAVGDSMFQTKCLKKMRELGQDGRTIIFVSHSPESVMSLCNKAIYLENGSIKEMGDVAKCIEAYDSTKLTLLNAMAQIS
jgi:lipopolysaccharide transport system ATP-binding protein